MASSSSSLWRSPRLLALASLFLVATTLALFWRERPTVAVAYAVSLAGESAVRVGLWPTTIKGARTLTSGQSLTVPSGVSVALVLANGTTETLVGPTTRTIPDIDPSSRPTALSGELTAWLRAPEPPTGRGRAEGDPIVSPAVLTRHREPTFDWPAQPGITYDVALRDAADEAWPPRAAFAVKPPVAFSALPGAGPLRADRIYAVFLREHDSGRALAMSTFTVAPDATNDAPPPPGAQALLEAVAALRERPYRLGDAWLALRTLPAPWRETDLAQRLRLKLYHELGLADWFAQEAGEAQKRVAP